MAWIRNRDQQRLEQQIAQGATTLNGNALAVALEPPDNKPLPRAEAADSRLRPAAHGSGRQAIRLVSKRGELHPSRSSSAMDLTSVGVLDDEQLRVGSTPTSRDLREPSAATC